MAKEVLKLGMYIGFTGVLTFKNARKAVEVVQYARLTGCSSKPTVPIWRRNRSGAAGVIPPCCSIHWHAWQSSRGSLRRRWLPSPGKMPAQSTDCRNNTKRKKQPGKFQAVFYCRESRCRTALFSSCAPDSDTGRSLPTTRYRAYLLLIGAGAKAHQPVTRHGSPMAAEGGTALKALDISGEVLLRLKAEPHKFPVAAFQCARSSSSMV